MEIHLINFYGDNYITDLDFNPNGDLVATMDCYGTCLISDINTDNYFFHLNMETSHEMGKYNIEISIIYFVLILPCISAFVILILMY